MNLAIEMIIQQIKKSKKYSEQPIFTKEEVEEFEKDLKFTFPEEYKLLVTHLEPDIANFYFVTPYRYDFKKNFIVFAEWTDDVFAFDEKDYTVHTILEDKQDGMTWKDFTHWMNYIWEMGNKPINPE